MIARAEDERQEPAMYPRDRQDPQHLLQAQIEGLEEALSSTRRAMSALLNAQADPGQHQAIAVPFRGLFQDQQVRLGELKERLAQLEPGASLAGQWSTLESDIGKACRQLFDEFLACLGGLLLRQAGLDEDMCRLSDALIRQLAEQARVRWDGFTILGAGELYSAPSEVIRLRFPDFTIWSLPMAAHEFGHHVDEARRNQDFPHLYGEILFEESQGPFPPSQEAFGGQVLQLKEHFADLFAVHAVGPCFACTCIELRFEPSQAYVPRGARGQHPPDAERAYLILKALEAMDARYARLAGTLRSHWQQMLCSAGRRQELPPERRECLDRRLQRLLEALDLPRLRRARYQGWEGARWLAARDDYWRSASYGSPDQDWQRRASDLVARFSAAHGQPPQMADILNAAWLFRFEHPETGARRISGNALELCRASIDARCQG